MPRTITIAWTAIRIVVLSLLLSLPVLSVAGSTAAVAQNAGAKSGGGLPPAPVGHRQPTRSGLAQSGVQDDKNGLTSDADDKALDKKIKSICRGC